MRERCIPLMTKLNCMFLAIIVLACAVLSVFSYRLNQQAHLADISSQNTMLLRTMAQSIDTQMAQVEIVTREAAYNADLIQLLQEDNVPNQILSVTFDVAKNIQQSETYLSPLDANIVALSRNEHIVERFSTLVRESRLAGDLYYRAFLNSSPLSAWGNPENPFLAEYATNEPFLPFYHKVITGINTRIGAVRCDVSIPRLFAPLVEYSGGNTLMVLRNSEPVFVLGDYPAPTQKPSERWQEGGYLYFAVPLDHLGAWLVMSVDSAFIHRDALQDTALSTLAIFILGVALLLVTQRIVRVVLSRLHSLTDAVSAIPQGIYAVTLPEEGPDEVGRLARAFSSLLERIGTYYDALLQKEKDKRHAQSMALQYQLNPHFLFNSLYWLQLQMEEQNVDADLTDSIEHLGKVLHYNLLGPREALLSEEEEHILAYVSFVSAMKGSNIRLSIDMPDELRSAHILRFTLQPLLENAVQHGYIAGQDMCISIAFRADPAADRFEIAVHNDGSPIPANRLAALQARLDAAALDGLPVASRENGHGTALCNLARRLALTYEELAELSFESDESGTCARIRLPLSQCMRKEEPSNENADRG